MQPYNMSKFHDHVVPTQTGAQFELSISSISATGTPRADPSPTVDTSIRLVQPSTGAQMDKKPSQYPGLSIQALALNTRALARQIRESRVPELHVAEADVAAEPQLLPYRTPNVESTARYLALKNELFPNEPVYGRNDLKRLRATLRAAVSSSSADDSPLNTSTSVTTPPLRARVSYARRAPEKKRPRPSEEDEPLLTDQLEPPAKRARVEPAAQSSPGPQRFQAFTRGLEDQRISPEEKSVEWVAAIMRFVKGKTSGDRFDEVLMSISNALTEMEERQVFMFIKDDDELRDALLALAVHEDKNKSYDLSGLRNRASDILLRAPITTVAPSHHHLTLSDPAKFLMTEHELEEKMDEWASTLLRFVAGKGDDFDEASEHVTAVAQALEDIEQYVLRGVELDANLREALVALAQYAGSQSDWPARATKLANQDLMEI
ncbi:hypothetical protein BKA62DRAFT_170913 [Auriculariales sp. MPI-PUGE-AT-0066]|nr:hypothetical protein BKA62DRAFT_170913 [Auriculariales sp. MPI-PUGE-AT-0066]